MESIDKAIEKLKLGKLEERLNHMSKEVLQDRRIQVFISNNPDLTRTQIERGLNELYQYKTQWQNCDTCPGLEKCPNLLKGYQPTIHLYRQDLQLEYKACPLKRKDEEQKRQLTLIQSLYIPKEIMKATFEAYHQDHPSRTRAINKAGEFIMNIQPGESGRGLYIFGPFGVGKTYLMGAIANELADKGIRSMIIYAPDFFRELKSGISDGSYQQKLDNVKKAPVLILDDIGAETMSNWVRDDILGALLQFRMMEKLPTLFTSNFDLDELEHHLTYTQRGGLEKMDELKAKRIMERIRHLNDVIDMKGENKRG